MKLMMTLLAVSVVAASGVQAGDACRDPQTQLAMNQCAHKSYQEADGELNRVYMSVRALRKNDSVFLEKLTLAQRAWIASRDADLEASFPLDDKRINYGSMYPLSYATLKERITHQRTVFLKKLITRAFRALSVLR